ncbi:low molecular weight protein-tyrosine-phosphatase [Vibrio sp. SCSIO 43136]|uniref:low molecular weight protein-tyrosine-phosphatase n=1 Tax=Vibrio sp. SCSIO 43136 TaxID=2819101 RepID=UPI002074F7C1|nr:low molecular weight protein-tyrosine-phosphatase [Vibrio sp. SCSIO 43136]USD64420.1 low molecular weight phosphotyrosine protein phosphatase [Vibrio sp. SCSIO 43136]
MKKVLVVCLGNICRSPTAEAVLRAKVAQAGADIRVDSAGTGAYHVGERPDSRSRAAGEKRGYSFKGIYARQVESQDFEQFDLVLAADRSNLDDLLRQCPDHLAHKVKLFLSFGEGVTEEIPDPYYGGDKGFELVLDLIEDASQGVIEALK